ncbi:hypothetical protein PV328_010355 [Microctonus aethiopoides]|uniref:Uncharacterized protein n=1 Tax=Microctonus aethiopoides TaxID=144406 RepID=A0AA39FHV7_9HYME|nr:hypothetical protein PV328_010355 [Microctonus aethiopoides]
MRSHHSGLLKFGLSRKDTRISRRRGFHNDCNVGGAENGRCNGGSDDDIDGGGGGSSNDANDEAMVVAMMMAMVVMHLCKMMPAMKSWGLLADLDLHFDVVDEFYWLTLKKLREQIRLGTDQKA